VDVRSMVAFTSPGWSGDDRRRARVKTRPQVCRSALTKIEQPQYVPMLTELGFRPVGIHTRCVPRSLDHDRRQPQDPPWGRGETREGAPRSVIGEPPTGSRARQRRADHMSKHRPPRCVGVALTLAIPLLALTCVAGAARSRDGSGHAGGGRAFAAAPRTEADDRSARHATSGSRRTEAPCQAERSATGNVQVNCMAEDTRMMPEQQRVVVTPRRPRVRWWHRGRASWATRRCANLP
jgi:hypothetical protein